MSFLLRNRSNNSGQGRFPPRSSSATTRGPATAGRSSTHVTNKTIHGSTAAGIQSGNQMMLQRTEPQRLQTKTSSRQSQQQSVSSQQQRDQESQGVISMTEVLADLRVLEQQQKDAERKLKTARVIKGQRLEQQHALQCKLERLKYTNGELRAQLRQSREHLSTGTRTLGSRRLATDNAGGEIRDFEKVLKRGLQSARVNAACRRKIDSVFILIENKLSTLARLKVAAKGKLSQLEATMKAERRKEENLRSSIQSQVARVQQCASDIANVRAQNIEAEKDLLDAQNIEESTRTRAQTLADQIAGEKKHIEEQTAQLSSQIAAENKKAEDLVNQNEHAKKDLQDRIRELDEARIRQISSSAQPKDDAGGVESAIASCSLQSLELGTANDALHKKIEEMQSVIHKNAEISAAKRKTCEALTRSAEEMISTENNRSQELNAFSSELDLERKAVAKLEVSAQELQESRSRSLSNHNQMVLDCEKDLEQARQEIDSTKSILESENAAIADGKSAWETEKADLLRRLEEARKNFKEAETSMNELDEASKHFEEDGESGLRRDLLEIEEQKAVERHSIDEQVESITQKFPKLQSVVSNFVYDSSVDVKSHMHEALGPIKSELRSMIQDAKAIRQRKEEERQGARRKAEAASKELKRKDEERRKSRERFQAELKKKEAEDPFENLIDEDLLGDSKILRTMPLASKSHSSRSGAASSKGRKGAEFFHPQSQDLHSEEETPAQPKSLLSSFSHARGTSRKPASLDLTPNSDKRVHWKEDDAIEEAEDSEGKIVESNVETKPARKAKQYGTSKRGLAAISRPRKDYKTAPKVETKMSIQDILDADSDDSSLDVPKEQAAHNKTQTKTFAEIDATADLATTSNRSKNSEIAFEAEVTPKKVPQLGDMQRKHSASDQVRKMTKSNDIAVTGNKDKIPARDDHASSHSDRTARQSHRPNGRKHRTGDAIVVNKTEKESRPEEKSRDRNRASGGVMAQDQGFDDSRHKKHVSPASRESVGKHPRSRSNGLSKAPAHRDPSTKGSSRSVASDSTRISHRSKSADETRSVSSAKSSSRSVASHSSRASGHSKRSNGTAARKRKSREPTDALTQASGLSSCEGGTKPRRRKKTSTSQASSMNLTDDAYSFAF